MMNAVELREIEKRFYHLYATKRPWHLRIPPVLVLPTPAPPPVLPLFNQESTYERFKKNWVPTTDVIYIVMKRVMTRGHFGFLLDRVGDLFTIQKLIPLPDNEKPITAALTSALWEVNSTSFAIQGVKSVMQDKDEPFSKQKDASRRQMIAIFTASPFNLVKSSPSQVTLTFARPPELHTWVHKIHYSSRYKRKNRVLLVLRAGFVNFFSNQEKVKERDGISISDSDAQMHLSHANENQHIVKNTNTRFTISFKSKGKTRRTCWEIETESVEDWIAWVNHFELAKEFAYGNVVLP